MIVPGADSRDRPSVATHGTILAPERPIIDQRAEHLLDEEGIALGRLNDVISDLGGEGWPMRFSIRSRSSLDRVRERDDGSARSHSGGSPGASAALCRA